MLLLLLPLLLKVMVVVVLAAAAEEVVGVPAAELAAGEARGQVRAAARGVEDVSAEEGTRRRGTDTMREL